MPIRRALLVSLALAPWLSGVALAQPVQIVGQSRSVEAASTTFGNLWHENQNPFFPDFDQPGYQQSYPTSDQATAGHLMSWTDSAATQDPPAPIVGSLSGSALATQDSDLSPFLVEATGTVEIVTDSYLMTPAEVQLIDSLLNPPVPFFFGTVDDNESARSHHTVTFDVAATTPYALSGALAFDFLPPAQGSIPGDVLLRGFIELAESGGPVIGRAEIDCSSAYCSVLDPTLDSSGSLAPGTYVLSAEIEGFGAGYCYDAGTLTCFMPGGDASFTATLTLGGGPPVPALGGAGRLLLALGVAALGIVAPLRLRRAAAPAAATRSASSARPGPPSEGSGTGSSASSTSKAPSPTTTKEEFRVGTPPGPPFASASSV
jgi:hypothetical protein